MQKFIDMLSKALRWVQVALKLIPMAQHNLEEIMLLVAITRAEFMGASESLSGADKRNNAMNYLKKNFLFKNKNTVELNKMIESAYLFKFHKEK